MIIVDYSDIYKNKVLNMQLRKEDAIEILTSEECLNPENIPLIINNSIEFSINSGGDCQLFLDENKDVIAVFGVARELFGNIVWLLGTDKINLHKKEFVKKTKVLADFYTFKYQYIYNFVDSRYTKAIKWIKALGFLFDDSINISFMKVPFYYFYRIRE